MGWRGVGEMKAWIIDKVLVSEVRGLFMVVCESISVYGLERGWWSESMGHRQITCVRK